MDFFSIHFFSHISLLKFKSNGQERNIHSHLQKQKSSSMHSRHLRFWTQNIQNRPKLRIQRFQVKRYRYCLDFSQFRMESSHMCNEHYTLIKYHSFVMNQEPIAVFHINALVYDIHNFLLCFSAFLTLSLLLNFVNRTNRIW